MHTKREQEENSNIQTLPDEILTGIFSYLRPQNILNTIRLVSWKFYWLSYDPAFWRREFRLHSLAYFRETRALSRAGSANTTGGFLESWLNRLIHWAIRNKSQRLLDYFYQHGIVAHYERLNITKDRHNRTRNHWAAICNQLAEFNNADKLQTEDRDESERTVLVIAAQHGHLNLVKEILANKSNDSSNPANLPIRIKEMNFALVSAAAAGHTDVINVLHEHGAEIDAIDSPSGTALMAAVAKGHYEVVEFLLQRGANINAIDPMEKTALTLALNYNYTDIVRLLLKNGADVNVNLGGFTVFSSAKSAMIKILIEETILPISSDTMSRALTDAFRSGIPKRVKLLLENNKTAISSDIFEALLLEAILCRKPKMVRALFTNSSHTIPPSTLETLLTIAHLSKENLFDNNWDNVQKAKKLSKIIEILINKGAKIEISQERILIYLVARLIKLKALLEENDTYYRRFYYNYLNSIVLILKQTTNANATDEKGKTALCLAAENGDREILSTLLDFGAEINFPSSGKKTALIYAAEAGHLHNVVALVEKGADINARDEQNNTALIIAAEKGKLKIVDFLLKTGVKPAQRVEALTRATQKGQLKVVERLRVEMVEEATVAYLNWRATEAPGHRFFNRFNHWYHGSSGIKRTENILQQIRNGVSSHQLMQEVKLAVEDSSHRKHSYSRYIFDVFKGPATKTVDNQNDEEFLELKTDFLANYDQEFLSL